MMEGLGTCFERLVLTMPESTFRPIAAASLPKVEAACFLESEGTYKW